MWFWRCRELLRRNPAFGRLYLAQLISFGGDWFASVALLGLTLQLTGSAAAASLVLVLQTMPFFLAAPLAGVIADRVDRQRLLVATDLLRSVIALGVLLARDPATLWIAFLCTGLLSAGAAFFEPTSAAALPNLVDDEDLPAANVLMGSAWGTMLAVGAALGGLVTATLGRDAAFFADALSFLASALLIVGIRRPFSEKAARIGRGVTGSAVVDGPVPGGLRDAVRETVALARTSRAVAALLLSKATFGVGTGAILLLAVFGRDVFGAGDVGIGFLFAARGLGALIGPFLARSLISLDDRGLIVGIGTSFIVFDVCYMVFPLAPTIWLAGLLVFGAHLGGGAQWTLSTYGLQRATPDRLRGRVFSFDYALVTLSIALSTVSAGMLVGAVGPRGAVFALMGVSLAAGTAWLVWTRSLRRAVPVSEGL